MRSASAALVILCAASASAWAGATGCGKRKSATAETSPLLHTTRSHDETVDVARAAGDADELRRALVRPFHVAADAAGGKLGAHRFEASSKLRVTEAGAEVEALDLVESGEMSAEGAFHVVSRNSKDYGREAFYVPGAQGGDDDARVWIRPGFGKFHRRAPAEPGEAARLYDETFATLGADFDLVASAASVKDAGPTSVAGRPARKVTLALGTARPRSEPTPERAWREQITVQALAGEVALDDATGLPLAGQLTAKLTFVREGHTYEMTVEATHAVKDVGAAVAITPPADTDSVATPERSRDFEDREELLHGIAPPAKRGPTGK